MRLTPQALQGLGFVTAYNAAPVQTAPPPPPAPIPVAPPAPVPWYRGFFGGPAEAPAPTAPVIDEAAAFAAEAAAAAVNVGVAAVEIPITATTAAFGGPGGLQPPVPEPTAPAGTFQAAATLPVAAAAAVVDAAANAVNAAGNAAAAAIPVPIAPAGPDWTPEALNTYQNNQNLVKYKKLIDVTRTQDSYYRLPGVNSPEKRNKGNVPARLQNLLNIAQGNPNALPDVNTTQAQAQADVNAFIQSRRGDTTAPEVNRRREEFRELQTTLANENRLGGGNEAAAQSATQEHPLVSLIGGFFRK